MHDDEVAVLRGNLEARAGKAHGAVGATLATRNLDTEGRSQFSRIWAVAPNRWPFEVTGERCGIDLGVHGAVVLLLFCGQPQKRACVTLMVLWPWRRTAACAADVAAAMATELGTGAA
jgi:hypothetical protein